MAELNELRKFSFGGHSERATLGNISPSCACAPESCGRRDWGSNLNTGRYEPSSYMMGSWGLCENHHIRRHTLDNRIAFKHSSQYAPGVALI